MEIVVVGISDILTAFNEVTIGSKVINKKCFMADLEEEIRKINFAECRVPGQAYVELPDKFCRYVSAGVGKRTTNPDDYVTHLYREKVKLYLKRQFAAQVDKVAVVVYTTDAYLKDPDVTESEIEWLTTRGYTHMLVAVLASAGPKTPLTPYRFVHNLAGGNREAEEWTADEIREKSKEIISYSNEWCTVAD